MVDFDLCHINLPGLFTRSDTKFIFYHKTDIMNEICRWYFCRLCWHPVVYTPYIARNCMAFCHFEHTSLIWHIHLWAMLEMVQLRQKITRQLLPMNIASIWNPGANIQQFIQHSATTQKQSHSKQRTKTAWNTNQYKIDFVNRSMDLRHVNRNRAPKNNVSISIWCNPAEWTPRSLTL